MRRNEHGPSVSNLGSVLGGIKQRLCASRPRRCGGWVVVTCMCVRWQSARSLPVVYCRAFVSLTMDPETTVHTMTTQAGAGA